MKKAAIALAVAATTLTPMLAQADSKLVGSLRYGLTYSDDGTTDSLEIKNFGSRIKWSGNTDLGNGLTAIGALELRLDSDRGGSVNNRLYYVGLKGGFGQFTVGLQDSAYDIVNPDSTWWWGSDVGLTGNRSEKKGVAKYSGSFGGAQFAVAAVMNETTADELDMIDAAAKYTFSGLTLGAGVQSKVGGVAGEDGTAVAVTGRYDFGAGKIDLTYGMEDEDFSAANGERTALLTQLTYGNFIVFYGQSEIDGANSTPTNVGATYTQSVGPQTTVWYEVAQNDKDDGSDATINAAATLKYDF